MKATATQVGKQRPQTGQLPAQQRGGAWAGTRVSCLGCGRWKPGGPRPSLLGSTAVLLLLAGGAAPADAPCSLRHGASRQGSASSLAASCPAWTQQRDQVLGEEEARTGERTAPRSLCAKSPRPPGRGPSSITPLTPSIMVPAPALWSKRPRAEGKGQLQRHPEGQAGLWPHWKGPHQACELSQPSWVVLSRMELWPNRGPQHVSGRGPLTPCADSKAGEGPSEAGLGPPGRGWSQPACCASGASRENSLAPQWGGDRDGCW